MPTRLATANLHSIEALRQAAAACTNCDLYANATQTVFGEGPNDARLVLVGEQPGDQEDIAGKPFVGPAGRILDEALEEAGIDRSRAYITNAVKHFRWMPRGKKRIHQRPNVRQMRACLPWLEQEVDSISPEVLVCMGSLATQAVLGNGIKVLADRGRPIESAWAPTVLVTVHPSSILRQADSVSRRSAFAGFVEDLRVAAGYVSSA